MTKIKFFKTKMTIDYLKGCNLYFRLNIILSTIVNNFFPLFILLIALGILLVLKVKVYHVTEGSKLL